MFERSAQRMRGLLNRFSPRAGPRGTGPIEIGWLVDAPNAKFIYDPPKPVALESGQVGHAKSPSTCPAVLAHRAGLYQIDCPLDLHLRVRNLKTPKPVLVNAAGSASSVSPAVLDRLVVLMPRQSWLHPDRPLLQVSAPWRFISDDVVYLNQLPPIYHFRNEALPGLMIGGRFAIRSWPRSLMWAFEWHDTSRDLVLTRGEPWFYVGFETESPQRRVRLLEAQMTDQLREFCNGLDGVAAHVRQTNSLLKVAEERRPAKLLQKKVRS